MTTTDQFIALEREALDQWAKGRITGYFKHAADSVLYFDDIGAQGGIQGLAALLEYGKALEGQIPEHRYEMADVRGQDLGDTHVLSYFYLPFSLEGKPLTKWRASVVYARRNGDWKMVHAHWTMMKTHE